MIDDMLVGDAAVHAGNVTKEYVAGPIRPMADPLLEGSKAEAVGETKAGEGAASGSPWGHAKTRPGYRASFTPRGAGGPL
jgi:hypothetical protein